MPDQKNAWTSELTPAPGAGAVVEKGAVDAAGSKRKKKPEDAPVVPAAPAQPNASENKESVMKDVTASVEESKEPKFANLKDSAHTHYTEEEMKAFNVKEFVKRHFMIGSKVQTYTLKEMHILLDLVKAQFMKSGTLIEIKAPTWVCGDIHGQYTDLMRIFTAGGIPTKEKYLFLGDYVDRGRHSLEVINLLFGCRLLFPRNIHLLRGNHELPNINKTYGFLTEIKARLKDEEPIQQKYLYDHYNDVFAWMPLAGIISGRILCMHGGLSPDLHSLDDIRKIHRPILRLTKGLAQDLLWADPEANVKGFIANTLRAVSYQFGEDAVAQKLKELDIDMVIRAHQVVEFGYSFFASQRLITVFSAARYHDELVNYAAMVRVNDALEVSVRQMRPVEFVKERKDLEKKRQTTNDKDDDE